MDGRTAPTADGDAATAASSSARAAASRASRRPTLKAKAPLPPPPKARIFASAPDDPSQDLLTQLAKLSDGLTSDRYADANEDSGEASEAAVGVQPRMFKSLVGKGHPEFSSARQQDAQEYWQVRARARAACARACGHAWACAASMACVHVHPSFVHPH